MIPDAISVRALRGAELDASVEAVAALRSAVFRDWPYLYDGVPEFERQYIATYRDQPGALLVAAFDGARLIGASTSTLMEDHSEAFAGLFAGLGIAVSDVLYGAESVLLPAYRGIGLGHRFIDLREAHARAMGRGYVAFCAVKRPAGHPARPADARSNAAFWQGRGYTALPGVEAAFAWKDIGDSEDSEKKLQFWLRKL